MCFGVPYGDTRCNRKDILTILKTSPRFYDVMHGNKINLTDPDMLSIWDSWI